MSAVLVVCIALVGSVRYYRYLEDFWLYDDRLEMVKTASSKPWRDVINWGVRSRFPEIRVGFGLGVENQRS